MNCFILPPNLLGHLTLAIHRADYGIVIQNRTSYVRNVE
jgi:hypothetical protein